MSTPEPPVAEPQGAWVREVVRDLADADQAQSAAVATDPSPAPAAESDSPASSSTATPAPSSTTPPASTAPEATESPTAEPPAADPPTTEAPATYSEPPAAYFEPATSRPADTSDTTTRPRPAAFDDSAITSRVRHGETWPRRAARWVRSNVRAGQEDARLVELLQAVRRPVTTGRRIAVTGVRGGVGTTTVTLVMGAVLANRRDDPILAVDADQELGTLSWRAQPELPPSSSESDPESEPSARPSGLDQLQAFVPRTPQGLWMLPAPATEGPGGSSATGSADGTEQPAPSELYREFGRFFGVTVFDCGSALAGPRGQSPGRTGSSAHAAVLVATATVDGVRAAHQTLTSLALRPNQPHDPLAHLVVALVSRTPRPEGLDLRGAVRALEKSGPSVVHLPYDRHLAAGARVDLTRLAEPTLLAATDLAGQVLSLARQRDDRLGMKP